eukprot:TRINITY_DN33380_c0_g1_i1.p1 TRINITY_DN33380_c0_g1~~TRINITY_DN33380_c0_g1_i1.p1  ORF type:complete len:405 (-),score=14.71 TRINITY_DN33380_c0_g1_i1:231-1445(-)
MTSVRSRDKHMPGSEGKRARIVRNLHVDVDPLPTDAETINSAEGCAVLRPACDGTTAAAEEDADIAAACAATPRSPYVAFGGPISPFLLYCKADAPQWMSLANPMITTAYRAEMDAPSAAVSLFGRHNEFVNFWTHAIAAIAVVCTMAIANSEFFPAVLQLGYPPASESDASDASAGSAAWSGHREERLTNPAHVVTVHLANLNMVGSIICLTFSAAFHGFYCTGVSKYRLLSRLDYSGISVILLTSFLAPYYISFHCFPSICTLYLGVLVVTGTVLIVLPWTAWFASPKAAKVRSSIYAVASAQAALPLFHSLYLWLPGTPRLQLYFLLELAMYAVGALFYVTRWPERQWPGRFDIAGASHQIFHVFVAAAIAIHMHTLFEMIRLLGHYGTCDNFLAAAGTGQ